MIDLLRLINNAKENGYNEANAEAKVCQDVVLALISRSRLNRNVTVKGGVLMRSITNSSRRATQDIDLDFIRYSLEDESIDNFIEILNSVGDISIKRIGGIEELRQQDYHGKRINTEITDGTVTLKSKIDLGVHKNLEIGQEEFCFDVGLDDEGVSLLANSKEQVFTEKLRSVLKFGAFSTRYKDIFDIYYLCDCVNKEKLVFCFDKLIFSDVGMRESNLFDITRRMKSVFSNKVYVNNLKSSKKNWVDEDPMNVLEHIIEFFNTL